MTGMLAQFRAVIGMSLMALPGRLWSSLATVFATGLAVLTLLVFLGMAAGFSRTVAGTGADDVAMLVSASAKAEITSRIPAEAVRLLDGASGVARDGMGRAGLSPESFAIIEAEKDGGGSANIPLRGVTQAAQGMRPEFAIIEGRMFAPGSNELIVGAGVLDQFDGFELGQERRLGGATWKVVGVFAVGESVFDSEVWGDLSTVRGLFGDGGNVQAVRAKLESAAAIEALKTYVAGEPRLNLSVQSERAYFAGQAGKLGLLIFFGWALASLLAVGALAGALNAMYAAVEARAGENATLRAIGFGRWPVFAGAMAEALALSLAGALLASVVAVGLINGLSTSTLGEGFTQVVFQLSVGSEQLMAGLSLALVLGLVGGFFPALKAASAPVLTLGA